MVFLTKLEPKISKREQKVLIELSKLLAKKDNEETAANYLKKNYR